MSQTGLELVMLKNDIGLEVCTIMSTFSTVLDIEPRDFCRLGKHCTD